MLEPLEARLLIGGEWRDAPDRFEVRNPLDGRLAGSAPRGTAADMEAALRAASAAAEEDFPLHKRYEVLTRAAALIEADRDRYSGTIALEGSKTIREVQREPLRSAGILRLSVEAGRGLAGETLPFDSRVGSEDRVGYYFRFPVGVVGAITPFNDPLAMASHKVAPALAAGNAVVLKPGSATPLSAIRLAQHLQEAGLPPGRLNVVTGSGGELGDILVQDPRVRLVTFTGGVETGRRIARLAGIKKLAMELGSNSPVIVNADASLERAAKAVAAGAFTQAGQNCLGVQRVFVLEPAYERFRRELVDLVSTLKAGSSLDETTDVCAMIHVREAERIEAWVGEAVAGGARVLVGGKREGALYWPTVLEDVPSGAKLDCNEAYGPVVSLYRVASLDEAIDLANRVDYGLHGAVFTESIADAFRVIRRLSVGGVMVNDSTDYRLDVMPFGGTKLSGIGREGVRFALEEMTETRVVCFNL